VINIYPGRDISLGAVNTTSGAADSDFVTLGTAWFLDFLRPLSFQSGHYISETFCPDQCPIFGKMQKQNNTVVQRCHKSGSVSRLRSVKNCCGLTGTGTGFSPCVLEFYCLHKSVNASY